MRTTSGTSPARASEGISARTPSHPDRIVIAASNTAGPIGWTAVTLFRPSVIQRSDRATGKAKKTVASIFSSLQSDEIADDGDEDEGAEMDYYEFLEGLAAASCYKNPNPYVGLDQRIEHFLLSQIFPGGSIRDIRIFT